MKSLFAQNIYKFLIFGCDFTLVRIKKFFTEILTLCNDFTIVEDAIPAIESILCKYIFGMWRLGLFSTKR